MRYCIMIFNNGYAPYKGLKACLISRDASLTAYFDQLKLKNTYIAVMRFFIYTGY